MQPGAKTGDPLGDDLREMPPVAMILVNDFRVRVPAVPPRLTQCKRAPMCHIPPVHRPREELGCHVHY
jgi:hypothetical protein